MKNLINKILNKYREFFPLRILRARIYPKQIGNAVQVFDIKNLIIKPGDEHLEKTKDQFINVTNSMDNLGLIFPITVTSYEKYWFKDKWPKDKDGNIKKGLLVLVGNQRVLYAKKRRYHKIEGYFVNTKVEKDIVNSKTFMRNFPNNWVEFRDLRLF